MQLNLVNTTYNTREKKYANQFEGKLNSWGVGVEYKGQSDGDQ